MELRTLKTFILVAKMESFSKAANALGYTQAAVTIQIQQLEKELSTRLFDRFSKKISLTQQGTLFYSYACHILQESEEAICAMQETQGTIGHLRIGMIESLCASVFPVILHAFHAAYPQVMISIETSSPEHLLEKMNHNELDIVYFIDKKRYHHDWFKVLEIPEEIVFVTSCQHPLAMHGNLTLDDILKEELILTENAASYRYELEQYVLSLDQQLTPYLEIGNTDFIIHELLLNQGISFLPRYCVDKYIREKRLCILKPKDFSLQVYRQIVYHKNKWVTPQMNAFLSFIKEK